MYNIRKNWNNFNEQDITLITPEYAEVEHLFLVILAPGGPRLSATPLTPSACSRPSRPFPWQSVQNWKRYHFSNTRTEAPAVGHYGARWSSSTCYTSDTALGKKNLWEISIARR